jgi:RNA polymerase sigma-70 factor (ECF subfamily)
LSRGSRQALLLSTIEGRSYEQIASQAGIALGTVKSRIGRGRASLKRLLEGKALGDARSRRVGIGMMNSSSPESVQRAAGDPL